MEDEKSFQDTLSEKLKEVKQLPNSEEAEKF